MSEAGRYLTNTSDRLETMDVNGLMEEIFSKVAALVEHTGINFTFTNLHKPIYCLVDRDMLERSILNLLSNALKFTPQGGNISAALTKRAGLLILTIQDDGEGVTESLKGSFFNRYQRQSALEDSRHGIGLGMLLVRSAAAHHGGTVLLDQPEERGTRVTMTLALRQNTEATVRSPIFRVDYAGERDHGLLELAESLPSTLYEKL